MNDATEAKPGLFAALAKFQAELPEITKGAKADAGTYSYSYADLADVSTKGMRLLGKHGLAFMAKPTTNDKGDFVLAYKLAHSSGEAEEGEYTLPSPERVKPQQMGSAITYARRYSFCAVTGIAPKGDDDDGHEAQQAAQAAWQPHEEAGPPEPSADADDGDWGDWHDVIKDITTPEEADQADQDLREVFKTGAMGPTKAGNIRAAIKKRKADVAGPPSPDGKRQEEVPA